MKPSSASSNRDLRVALVSVQPTHADKIMAGDKVLEFRRRWTSLPVDAVVIYSSSPVQRIVVAARVANVTEGSPTSLWELAKVKPGGITRRQLYDYFSGLANGFAIELCDVLRFGHGLNPRTIFREFRAPQSFRYLRPKEYEEILSLASVAL